MRVLLQRVLKASVRVDGEIVATIGPGALVLVGVGRGDTGEDAHYLAAKVSRLRVFDDAEGKMNEAAASREGAFLCVSQFTLYGDCRKGNRPSFIDAAPPEEGRRLFDRFTQALRACGHVVETGVFQAHMQVELVNDGPVTIWLESEGRAGSGRPDLGVDPVGAHARSGR